jgi:SanA protein
VNSLDQVHPKSPPNAKRSFRRWVIVLSSTVALGLFLCFSPFFLRWWVDRRYKPRIYVPEDVPSRRVAIVFGAGITADGRPMPALADRVWTASELYKAGKVEKLLMSGDNRFVDYNEPEAMRQYALEQGVPDEDIVLDYAGRRTYDTCYRADYIFGVEEAVLVTQWFHLDRALYICDRLGIDAVGVAADRREYYSARYWWLREVAAVARAWLDLNWPHSRTLRGIYDPTPVLGDKEPIL